MEYLVWLIGGMIIGAAITNVTYILMDKYGS